jgi:hypothetical protein
LAVFISFSQTLSAPPCCLEKTVISATLITFKPLKFFITSAKPIIIAPPDAGAFPASALRQAQVTPEAGNKTQLYSSAGAL